MTLAIMRTLCSLTLLCTLVSVHGGILKDIINIPKCKLSSCSDTSTMPTIISERKPLYHNEQEYLDDTNGVEREAKAIKVDQISVGPGVGAPVTIGMRQEQQGVYEFNIGRKTNCKFYIESRQMQRSLQCNQKRCNLTENNWICDSFACSIKEDNKEATCKDGGTGKPIIDAPQRNPCPQGQRKENGICRTPF